MNRPDPEPGIWTVHSDDLLKDADRLLASFLPKLFRRPVDDDVRGRYVAVVRERLDKGDCFESAMRAAFRNALVAPDFLYHIESGSTPDAQAKEDQAPEPPTNESLAAASGMRCDDYALACRLSYFLWNAAPDEALLERAAAGDLRKPMILHAEIERLLKDGRSQRFVEDFLGQWLKLRDIAATDPDKKLYPEFSPYLQDSMVGETRAYFRQLLDQDLDAAHLVKSPFVMVNQRLVAHYGIDGVSGSAIRSVPLPAGCPRGGLLTQAAILKVTANGTTTSPVPRGAFVIDRLLGQPPEPPPSNVAAIEPDVRGATTIREQLAKHRDHAVCASCHRRIDPPGFALESFDVIGGHRERYRSIGEGDPAPRGSIDPFIGISFRLGRPVDAAGEMPDGRAFQSIGQYQSLLAADPARLLRNLANQFAVYATGRAIRFSDRPAIDEIVRRTQSQGGGIRTLLHEVIGSPLFAGGPAAADETWQQPTGQVTSAQMDRRLMMTTTPADVTSPAIAKSELPTIGEPASPFHFDNDHTLTVQVAGLFIPDRVKDLQELMKMFPEAELREVEFETAFATIAYAAESDLFRGAKPEQLVERIDNRIRQLSGHTLAVKPPSTIPRDRLQRVEIGIVGLDCKACSLAVYEIVARIEGVEQAAASFHDSLAVAWIDPNKTNRAAIEETLKRRGVQLTTP